MTRLGPLGLLLLALLPACKPPSPDDAKPTKVDPSELPNVDAKDDRQPLRAAGIELKVPSDWKLLAEDEPNFALAYREEKRAPHIPVCTIEVRRQGTGPLPNGAHEVETGSGIFEYQRGALRGRVQVLAGPEGSSIVAHCRAPRSTQQWATITDIFASLRETGETAALPPKREPAKPDAAKSEIVGLCTGAPARMTMACALRGDGAVFCGATTADSLERVPLTTPAVQISCLRTTACARDASGAVVCWRGVDEPVAETEIEGARDLTGALIVDSAGKLRQRTAEGLIEVAPFGDPKLALTDVEQVLAGSNEDAGCVLRDSLQGLELWCWDRVHALPLELAQADAPQRIAAAAGATDLARMGDRLCLASGDGRWTCTDADAQRFTVDDCSARACGCSLIGASRWSCEHEPFHPIDARPLGRVTDVVLIADPCAALADGTLVCRGPLAGQTGEDPGDKESFVTELPGIAHTLTLPD